MLTDKDIRYIQHLKITKKFLNSKEAREAADEGQIEGLE